MIFKEIKGDIKEIKAELKGDIKEVSEKVSGIDTRLSNVEASVQKIPDLSEKIGELKNCGATQRRRKTQGNAHR